MVERRAASTTGERHTVTDVQPVVFQRKPPYKVPLVASVIVYRAFMATSKHLERAVPRRHVVNENAAREQAVVCVRVVHPVLMPMHRTSTVLWFHI